MKFLSQFWSTIKPTVIRFPASFLLSALFAIFISVSFCNEYSVEDEFYYRICLSCVWAFGFSVFAQLALEKLLPLIIKKSFILNIVPLIFQLVCVILAFFPGYYFCTDYKADRFLLIYFGTLASLFVLCLYLLSFSQQKEKVIPNVLMALVISTVIALCIGVGGSVIVLAIDKLIYEFSRSGDVYGTIWWISFGFFFPCTFLAYATKKNEDISIPKTFKVIILYTLFSLYCILLLVLYFYLIKSLVEMELPSGKINPFVSGATVLYLFFYLSLGNYKNKVTSFFYSYGSIFLLVLIAVQSVAFGIRVSSYGFTSTRVASFYYILFSLVFCVLPLVRKGKYMQSVYPLFAALCILGSLTPLNILDFANRNQYARIISTLKKYDLYKDNEIIPAPSEDTISTEDKKKIVDAFDMLCDAKGKKPDLIDEVYYKRMNFKERFKIKFGFTYYMLYGFGTPEVEEPVITENYAYNLEVPEKEPVNISGFSEMFYFYLDENYVYDYYNRKNRIDPDVIVSFGKNKEIDITQEVSPLLYKSDIDNIDKINSTQSLIIKKDGFTLIIREMKLKKKMENGKISSAKVMIRGYACR